MKKLIRILFALALFAAADVAMAKGGGKGSMPAPPPAPAAPPIPAADKAPEAETVRRRNRQAGMEGTNSTVLTGNDPAATETGLTLGGNTLLGS